VALIPRVGLSEWRRAVSLVERHPTPIFEAANGWSGKISGFAEFAKLTLSIFNLPIPCYHSPVDKWLRE
jgi:hypothetical protein